MRYKTQTAKRGYVIRTPQGTELAHENATKDPKREPEGEPKVNHTCIRNHSRREISRKLGQLTALGSYSMGAGDIASPLIHGKKNLQDESQVELTHAPDLKIRIGISTCLEPELDNSLAGLVLCAALCESKNDEVLVSMELIDYGNEGKKERVKELERGNV
jgi:hypothetical protein